MKFMLASLHAQSTSKKHTRKPFMSASAVMRRENNSTMSTVVLAALERELARWEWRQHLTQRPKTDLGVEAATLLQWKSAPSATWRWGDSIRCRRLRSGRVSAKDSRLA